MSRLVITALIFDFIYWYGPWAQMKVFIDRASDFLDVECLRDTGRQIKGKYPM